MPGRCQVNKQPGLSERKANVLNAKTQHSRVPGRSNARVFYFSTLKILYAMKVLQSTLNAAGNLVDKEIEVTRALDAYDAANVFFKTNADAVSLHSATDSPGKFCFSVKSKAKIIFQIKSC